MELDFSLSLWYFTVNVPLLLFMFDQVFTVWLQEETVSHPVCTRPNA